jgi:hypothetical protein
MTHEQIRTLVFIYRGGGFDKALVKTRLKAAAM